MRLPFETDGAIAAVLAHWEQARGTNVLPQFDVVAAARALGRHLRHVNLLELTADGRLVARVWAGEARDFYGRDLTGQDMLAFMPAEQRPFRLRRVAEVVERPCALQVRLRGASERGVAWRFVALALPVRRAGHARPMILHTAEAHGLAPGGMPAGGAPFPLADEAVLLDIGAGVPDVAADPGTWGPGLAAGLPATGALGQSA